MAAYIIAQINITNPEKYEEYAKLAGPATAKYGGKLARRFYNSPEYQEAKSKRLGAADFNMIIVEGS